jgi:uncharacterized membrane protein
MDTISPAAKNRVFSIDILRGIVMILMALDHTRDFFHNQAMTADPLAVATTSTLLYFTRWVTHFCAPVFVMLAGCSAYLSGMKKTKSQLSSFLIKRGLWLILVEVLLITLALSFNPTYSLLFLQVIWAIGISMVILGVLIWLPYWLIFSIGLMIVTLHNLLDYEEAARQFKPGFLWDLLHSGRFATYPFAPGHALVIIYPFLPWLGIMIMGYCLGKIFRSDFDAPRRKKILITTGSAMIVLFVLIRLSNGYGDPLKWSEQVSGWRTILSFLNVNKYPPSLLYTLVMLGPALIVLALIENIRNGFISFVTVFGRVPFFYYVIHFYLIHTLCVIAFYLSGYGSKDIVDPNVPFLFRPASFGFDIGYVYLIWIGIILLLYPLCKKYDRYKSSHKNWWLSYL